MNGLRLLCLGIGDAFSARHYSTCFALESDGRWILVDCPHPIRKIVREGALAAGAPLDVAQLDAVVLTHLHGDHVSGLEVLAYYFRYVLDRRVTLYTHPDVARLLWPGVLTGSMAWAIEAAGAPPRQRQFEEFFDYRPLVEDQPCPVGPFQVSCRHNVHSVPTIALKITAGGRTLGYSADTQFDPTLLDWLADADLVIHEANSGFMHTSVSDLMTARPEILAKMRLIHCADAYDAAASPLPMMRQGTLIQI
jgi:ribonuclease BN (tRNA processing enzyme)